MKVSKKKHALNMAVAPPEGEETGAKKKIKFQAEKNYYRLSQGEAQV